MNRQQRRAFNKRNNTNYSKEEFALIDLLMKLKTGKSLTEEELALLPKEYVTIDNETRAPEGSLVKLNYDRIKENRGTKGNPMYLDWIELNKDREFHLTREQGENSLVCLKEDLEDLREKANKGEETRQPWLFDIFSDLLFFNEESQNWEIL